MTNGPWKFGWDGTGEVWVDRELIYPADPANFLEDEAPSIMLRLHPHWADDLQVVLRRTAQAIANLFEPDEGCDTAYNMRDLDRLGEALAMALTACDGKERPSPKYHGFPRSPAEVLVDVGALRDVSEFGKPSQEPEPGEPIQGTDAGDEAE